jgi:hypothetical protein
MQALVPGASPPLERMAIFLIPLFIALLTLDSVPN